MRKLAIFDLDGTINTSNARAELVPKDPRKHAAWHPWHKAFRMERLNIDLIKTAQAYHKAGYMISVVSNRDENLSMATSLHLYEANFPTARYHLRNIEDTRTTVDWKSETIQNLLAYAGKIEVHHFDDDKKALEKLTEQFKFDDDILYIPHLVSWR